MTEAVERMEVQRTIEAEPAAIFEVLADPHGHVAIDASGMLQDATGEPATAVGLGWVSVEGSLLLADLLDVMLARSDAFLGRPVA